MPDSRKRPGIFAVLTIMALPSVTYAKDSLMIEGLSYIDQRPVEVRIQDGKIQRIRSKRKLGKTPDTPLHIAPGLIDNQVSGYASVSFGFGGGALTVEGVRKATEALWKEGVTT